MIVKLLIDFLMIASGVSTTVIGMLLLATMNVENGLAYLICTGICISGIYTLGKCILN